MASQRLPAARADQPASGARQMPADQLAKRGLKQKVTHEVEELVGLTAYLAVFFCVLTTYGLLLRETIRGALFLSFARSFPSSSFRNCGA